MFVSKRPRERLSVLIASTLWWVGAADRSPSQSTLAEPMGKDHPPTASHTTTLGGKLAATDHNKTLARDRTAKGTPKIGRCLLALDTEAWRKDWRGLLTQPFDLAA